MTLGRRRRRIKRLCSLMPWPLLFPACAFARSFLVPNSTHSATIHNCSITLVLTLFLVFLSLTCKPPVLNNNIIINFRDPRVLYFAIISKKETSFTLKSSVIITIQRDLVLIRPWPRSLTDSVLLPPLRTSINTWHTTTVAVPRYDTSTPTLPPKVSLRIFQTPTVTEI